MDIHGELRALVALLDESGVEYALCGGLALAVHGLPRATLDIDLLVPPESLEKAKALASGLGYDLESGPMRLAGGAVEIHRVLKADPGDRETLTIDLLPVTAALAEVWAGREAVEWAGGRLAVVSREGLIAMKSLRKSGQDLDDIERLRRDAR